MRDLPAERGHPAHRPRVEAAGAPVSGAAADGWLLLGLLLSAWGAAGGAALKYLARRRGIRRRTLVWPEPPGGGALLEHGSPAGGPRRGRTGGAARGSVGRRSGRRRIADRAGSTSRGFDPASGPVSSPASGTTEATDAGSGAGAGRAASAGRTLAVVAAGIAAAGLFGGLGGAVAGAVLAVVLHRRLPRPRSPDQRRAAAEQEALARQLPLTAELLAACLASSPSPSLAVAAVGRSVGAPMGRRLAAISAELALGAPPELSWRRLGRECPVLAPLGRCLVRTSISGAPPAGPLTALAHSQRTCAAREAHARVRRAGVLATAPLGVCFLPAFVLIGVVPVVLGLTSIFAGQM
ncbi:type II secretion system F family protein [Kitasatospora sp. NPDC057015]|uniref:type II secretion system F family protein n=1 Tax=Kitasatospora sp. NPDC057015 TaxID=3346001 RepID=UPI0036367C43